VTDGQTDRIPITNTRSQQYLPVQLSRVKIRKASNQLQPLPRSTIKFEKNYQLTNEFSRLISTHPRSTLSEDHISAPNGCCPLQFLHVLEYDQGLLTHAQPGKGGFPQQFVTKLKNWPKIQRMSANSFGTKGSNLTKLFHDQVSKSVWRTSRKTLRPIIINHQSCFSRINRHRKSPVFNS